MVDYKDRLKTAMEVAGVETAALARDIGVSYQAVKKVLDGNSAAFTAGNNSKVAQRLRVNSDWLASGRGTMSDVSVAFHRASESLPALAMNELQITQYDTGGRMGPGLILRDQPGVIKSWTVSRDWMQQNVHRITSVNNLVIVTGFGDSMQPLYNPGDPLLVDQGITAVEYDGVYFFRVGEEGFVKRLQRIPGNGILVISDNSKYRDWTIQPDADLEIFGKVVKAWRGQDF